MNHCVLEVQVKKAPTIRYTQDNKTPIAEMEVSFEGLRTDDSPGEIKVVGWGNMAQELQNQVQAGQKLVLEGRLRMNTVPRQDGTKEKRAELTLSKLHPLSERIEETSNRNGSVYPNNSSSTTTGSTQPSRTSNSNEESLEEAVNWNSSPLIPDTDEIPF